MLGSSIRKFKNNYDSYARGLVEKIENMDKQWEISTEK